MPVKTQPKVYTPERRGAKASVHTPSGAPRRSNSKGPGLTSILKAPQLHALEILALVTAAGVGAWYVDQVWSRIGFGAASIGAVALILLLGLRFAPKGVFRHLHRWLACCALGLIAWGALGWYTGGPGVLEESTLGGAIAPRIIESPNAVGVLRLIALGAISFVLLAPAVVRRLVQWIGASLWQAVAWAGRSAWYGVQGYLERRAERKAEEQQLKAQMEELTARAAEQPAEDAEAVREESEETEPAETMEEDDGEEKPRRAKPKIPAILGGKRQKPEKPSANGHRSSVNGAYKNGEIALDPTAEPGGWHLPSIQILDNVPSDAPSPQDNEARARRIEEALASYGIEASVVEINPGPAVTQFGVEPGWLRKFKEVRVRDAEGKQALDEDGKPIVRKEEIARTRVKVDAIANLDKDLALAMATPSIRIEAPIPGKSLVGIEVPNVSSEIVSLRSTLESPAFTKLKAKTKLPIALGKGSGGESWVADLTKMPHVLIAGSTGSGKSVCINALLCSILMTSTPRDVRMLLVDPKRVEMIPYNSVPHLITPVIVEVDKVPGALKWAMHEMDERYKKFSAVAARNLEAYNKHRLVVDPLPYLVIAIDELADLMMASPYDVEHGLTRLAQLGRATGIHLVVATQRPSVDVVTGLIKANFPTRVSFAVSSIVDSRTILDSAGAEKLLGKGDMLYLPQDAPKPIRIQGVYVSDKEVERIVRAWNQQQPGHSPPRITLASDGTVVQQPQPGEQPQAAPASHTSSPAPSATPVADAGDDESFDGLLNKARAIAEQDTRLSPSLLQRRLKIGYNKAKQLVEELEAEGYGESEEDVVR